MSLPLSISSPHFPTSRYTPLCVSCVGCFLLCCRMHFEIFAFLMRYLGYSFHVFLARLRLPCGQAYCMLASHFMDFLLMYSLRACASSCGRAHPVLVPHLLWISFPMYSFRVLASFYGRAHSVLVPHLLFLFLSFLPACLSSSACTLLLSPFFRL